MNPGHRSIVAVRKDSNYELVTTQQFAVYPGRAQLWVFRHVATGELWAAVENCGADSSDRDEPKQWREAIAEVVTRYKFVGYIARG